MTCIDCDRSKHDFLRRTVEDFRRQVVNNGHIDASNVVAINWEHLDVADAAESEVTNHPFDLVVLGNVVSEIRLGSPRTKDLLPGILRHLVKPGGHIVCSLLHLKSPNGQVTRQDLCDLKQQLHTMASAVFGHAAMWTVSPHQSASIATT